MADDVVHLMTHLADALHGNDKLLILVIPPTKENARDAQFTRKHFEKLKDVVDFFSLMTKASKYRVKLYVLGRRFSCCL